MSCEKCIYLFINPDSIICFCSHPGLNVCSTQYWQGKIHYSLVIDLRKSAL